MWKEHFKNLLGNSPKVTNKPITKIICSQRDIKLREILKKNSMKYLEKIKNKTAAGFDEIRPEIYKIRKFDDLLFRF